MIITLEQMAAQWKNVPHRIDVNIWNFTVTGAKEGEEIFKESFKLRRFNSAGASTWKPSNNKNLYHKYRGTLIEFGNLRDSIVGEAKRGSSVGKAGKHHRMYFHTSYGPFGIDMEERVDFRSVAYAATNNDGNPPGNKTTHIVNKKSNKQRRAAAAAEFNRQMTRQIPQRQFMPSRYGMKRSTVFDAKLEELESLIFIGIPGSRVI